MRARRGTLDIGTSRYTSITRTRSLDTFARLRLSFAFIEASERYIKGHDRRPCQISVHALPGGQHSIPIIPLCNLPLSSTLASTHRSIHSSYPNIPTPLSSRSKTDVTEQEISHHPPSPRKLFHHDGRRTAQLGKRQQRHAVFSTGALFQRPAVRGGEWSGQVRLPSPPL